jgi:hypothetical protein
MYILPPFRFTSYAIGIFSGFVLTRIREIKISSTQLYSLLTVSFSVLCVSIRLSAELTDENYKYDQLHAAAMTFLPIPFCFFFALIIFCAEINYTSKMHPHSLHKSSSIFILTANLFQTILLVFSSGRDLKSSLAYHTTFISYNLSYFISTLAQLEVQCSTISLKQE